MPRQLNTRRNMMWNEIITEAPFPLSPQKNTEKCLKIILVIAERNDR